MIRNLFQHCVYVVFFLLITSPVFSQGSGGAAPYLPVKIDGRWGYIDQTGEIVISPTFDEAEYFSDGWARVQTGEDYYFIDAKGSTVLKPDVNFVDSFSEGLAAASKKGSEKKGYINKKGRFVIEPQFDKAFAFSEGKASVYSEEKGGFGYINKKGKFIIEPRLDGARKFANGLAPAKTGGLNGQWGYVNARGDFVTEPQFEEAMPFSEGLAAVRTTVKRSKYVIEKNIWGYINREGKWIIEPEYEYAGTFRAGLAPVGYAAGWKFIDKEGESAFLRIGNKRIDFAEPFQGNLARATTDGLLRVFYGPGKVQFEMQGAEWVYLNRSGKIVWPKPKDMTKPSSIEPPEGYEKFEAEWPGSFLAIAYPEGWAVKNLNEATGLMEGVSFVKDKKAAQALYSDGNMEIATGKTVRLVTEGNVIINVAVQPGDASNLTPESFIFKMEGTVLNNAGKESIRKFSGSGEHAVVRSLTGTDADGRQVSSFQIATKRDGRLVSISAYMPVSQDEQVEGIILEMLESLKVAGK